MAFGYLSDLFKYWFGIDIPLPIPMFGLWVAAGFLAGAWVFKKDVQRMIDLGRLPKDIHPADFSSNLCLMAGISGIIGARLFHILEYPGEFMADPWGMIVSRGGYSILGGVAFGLIVCGRYVVKKGLHLRTMLDVGAPCIAMGYAVGRIGCQLSGDGDWGITANMALKPEWLPDWLWAYQYIGNVIGANIPPPGVYPTPLYESLASFLIFGLLWWFRNFKYSPGWLFSVYMVLSGLERLLVEQIRINAKYDLGFIRATQAEILSFLMIVGGLFFIAKWWRPRPGDEQISSEYRTQKATAYTGPNKQNKRKRKKK